MDVDVRSVGGVAMRRLILLLCATLCCGGQTVALADVIDSPTDIMIGSTFGVLPGPTTAEAALDAPHVDPAAVAAKARALALYTPNIQEQLASGFTGPPPRSAACSSSCVPDSMNLNVQGVPQQAPYWCVPGSTEIILRTMGGYDPGQARLAQQEHTTSMGTWVGNAVNPLNQYQNNNEYQLITDTSDAADLLDEAVTDIYGYNSAVMLTINVSKTWYYPVGWSGNHAIVDYGYYLFFGGGHNTFDPEDQRMFGYTRGFYGPHSGTVAQVWRAVAANGNNIVW